MNQNLQLSTDNYYSQPREQGKSIYTIWEEGKAYKDSITPTTYDTNYREFITNKIESLLNYEVTSNILSIGSGNAFVESDLHKKGYNVIANDVNEDAIEIARNKGLPVVFADVNQWEPEQKNFDLIYCDGVVGHLYKPEVGLTKLFSRLRDWLVSKQGILLISNDAAVINAPVHPHPRVKGFYWFSADYLRSELLSAGFEAVENENFIYHRPLTGEKERLILEAQVRS
ncbi:MAG: class I SAM-dependent methyltransferase [Moorea sp. SIOASIH]|uniref:class I SAM-dependent methyltransferase n=1 Tax=Moorena sp. SIOASIH TaxID=2607817 RepID=UPI0013B5DBD1|nr:class I SAM-dependent methyltransferase [Moorena sp. SIOASIH]NEO38722.1 class I SAM-dependent methyltransferase [Moorena sp. SIOASIH]